MAKVTFLIGKFEKGKVCSARSLSVAFETIRKNDYSLSISKYKEAKHEEVEFEDPDILIENLLAVEEEIIEDLKKLKAVVTSE